MPGLEIEETDPQGDLDDGPSIADYSLGAASQVSSTRHSSSRNSSSPVPLFQDDYPPDAPFQDDYPSDTFSPDNSSLPSPTHRTEPAEDTVSVPLILYVPPYCQDPSFVRVWASSTPLQDAYTRTDGSMDTSVYFSWMDFVASVRDTLHRDVRPAIFGALNQADKERFFIERIQARNVYRSQSGSSLTAERDVRVVRSAMG